MDQATGDENTCIGNSSGRGGSSSYHVGTPPSNAIMRLAQRQNIDLRAHCQSLQAQIDTKFFLHAQYHVCSWEHVRPHMCIIPKCLMLGLDPKRCKMKPLEEHMKEAILEVFNVPVNDRDQRKAFDRA